MEPDPHHISKTKKSLHKTIKWHIAQEGKSRIGHLVLNRPEAKNAISKQMWIAIPRCFEELRTAGANIIVIEGSGGSFAAGADIAELKGLENIEDVRSNWYAIANTLDFVYHFDLPVIAAINGPCMGGGCLLASACDLRYASDSSSFSVPVAKLGIALDDANLLRLSALIGSARTKEIIYRACVLSAREAESWGLVNRVFPQQKFASMLKKIVSEIAANSLFSIKSAKESLASLNNGSSIEKRNESTVIESYMSEDFKRRIKRALTKG